jgi:carboxylesterase type B
LFHRAISMAGTALSPWASCPDPLGMAQEQARLVNCSTANTSTLVACLRDIDPEKLVKTYPSVSRSLPLHCTVPARHRIVICVSMFHPHTILIYLFVVVVVVLCSE